jgi:small subunit ribosomal protein S8
MPLFVYSEFADSVFASSPTKACFPESKNPVGKYMITSLSLDFLIRLKNGSLADRKTITVPLSKFNLAIAALIKRYGYITDFSADKESRKINITLAYNEGRRLINNVKLFSRPGRRVYEKSFSLPWGQSPKSLIIISTSAGVISQKEAVKKGLGGEVIGEIY